MKQSDKSFLFMSGCGTVNKTVPYYPYIKTGDIGFTVDTYQTVDSDFIVDSDSRIESSDHLTFNKIFISIISHPWSRAYEFDLSSNDNTSLEDKIKLFYYTGFGADYLRFCVHLFKCTPRNDSFPPMLLILTIRSFPKHKIDKEYSVNIDWNDSFWSNYDIVHQWGYHDTDAPFDIDQVMVQLVSFPHMKHFINLINPGCLCEAVSSNGDIFSYQYICLSYLNK